MANFSHCLNRAFWLILMISMPSCRETHTCAKYIITILLCEGPRRIIKIKPAKQLPATSPSTSIKNATIIRWFLMKLQLQNYWFFYIKEWIWGKQVKDIVSLSIKYSKNLKNTVTKRLQHMYISLFTNFSRQQWLTSRGFAPGTIRSTLLD